MKPYYESLNVGPWHIIIEEGVDDMGEPCYKVKGYIGQWEQGYLSLTYPAGTPMEDLKCALRVHLLFEWESWGRSIRRF
jgi:hypothetical protein